MSKFDELKGEWKHGAEWDSDDYLSLYVISGTEESPEVYAKDMSDGEEFVITDIGFQKDTLTFKSLMPSTKRLGLNRFKLSEDGSIEAEFTFTVVERLERKHA